MIVWSLPGGDHHPIVLIIFTKLYLARPCSGCRVWMATRQLYYSSFAALFGAQDVIAAKYDAELGTKMKPGAHILRTIA